MKPNVSVFAITLIALFGATNRYALAQEMVPISTERPSAGPSADIIPRGSLQLETGLNLDMQHNQLAADLPETLFRLGLSHRIEVRYSSSNLVQRHSSSDGFMPIETLDTSISVKLLTSRPNAALPHSVILGLGLPTGSNSVTSGSYDPIATIVWDQTFRPHYSLIEVAQATLTTVAAAHRMAWAPGISISRTLSDKWAAFGEYAPTLQANGAFIYVADGGITYAKNPLLQFDARFGCTEAEDGLHLFLGVGISRRFDHLFSGPGISH